MLRPKRNPADKQHYSQKIDFKINCKSVAILNSILCYIFKYMNISIQDKFWE